MFSICSNSGTGFGQFLCAAPSGEITVAAQHGTIGGRTTLPQRPGRWLCVCDGGQGKPRFHLCPQQRGRLLISHPRGRPYNGRPSGLRTGSPPIPTAALDPPHRAASPAVPALIGSGSPFRPTTAPAERPTLRRKLPNFPYPVASGPSAVASQILANSCRSSGWCFSRWRSMAALPSSERTYPAARIR